MAHEILAVLGAPYSARPTIVARLIDDEGEAFGEDIQLQESSTVEGTFVGDIPDGTPRGRYGLLIYDIVDVPHLLLGSADFYWSGEREISLFDLQEIQNRVIASS